jgi:RecA/RadA recombinase
MPSMIDKLLNSSTIKTTAVLNQSESYNEKDSTPTDIAMLNVALSGRIDGGLTSGLTMIAGPSKHFKTMFSLILAAAYLKKNPDAAVLFYDSEFGTPQSYFEQFGIDLSRVIHVPITDIEMLKHDIVNQVTNITRGDKVFILIDSIGNLASKKEVEDSLEGKSVADMTRAKQLKSLFRMITPHLAMKNLPMVVINHTYKELSLFPKDIVGGGTGSYYSSDTIWIIGRQQEKDGKDVVGYNFVINIEKSRYAREKSKIPITVTYDHGIHKYSGVFDAALDAGLIKEV